MSVPQGGVCLSVGRFKRSLRLLSDTGLQGSGGCSKHPLPLVASSLVSPIYLPLPPPPISTLQPELSLQNYPIAFLLVCNPPWLPIASLPDMESQALVSCYLVITFSTLAS